MAAGAFDPSIARPLHSRQTSSARLLPRRSRSSSPDSSSRSKLYDETARYSELEVDGRRPLRGLDAFRLGSSFFLFGMLIAMQFSVVVAAAGDLVGDQAPKSAVLTAYTVPSVTVRLLVPFASMPVIKPFPRWLPLLRNLVPRPLSSQPRRKPAPPDKLEEEVNYSFRIGVCSACSFIGLNLLAWTRPLGLRLIGIALASCSSNLGDLSFYQMSTRYPDNITQSVGLYTSGGGAAGLVGALTYTVLTQLDVAPSHVIAGTGLVPVILILLYMFWLPAFPTQSGQLAGSDKLGGRPSWKRTGMIKDLGTRDKLSLARPMIKAYMMPLCALFLVELINVQGVLTTIIFYIPFLPGHYAFPTVLNELFPARRSFYPLYQTVYQLAAFLGRSAATIFRLPGGNRQDPTALWALVGTEGVILLLQLRESMSMRGSDDKATLYGPWLTLILVLCMGICGGMTLANVYYRIGRHPLPEGVWEALRRARRRQRTRGAAEYAVLPLRAESAETGDEESGVVANEDEDGTEREFDTDDEEAVDGEIEALHASDRHSSRPVILLRNPSQASVRSDRHRQQARLAKDDASLREFVVSTIGAADTIAILMASLLAMAAEPHLCRRQIQTGRVLCAAQ